MLNQENQSQVARLRQQIELECEAMQRLASGLAITASHATIQHKYACLGAAREELAQIIGEEEATTIVKNPFRETGEACVKA